MTKKRTISDEINQYDIFTLKAIEKGIFKIENNKIQYPNGKSYNFKDPEEKIRAKVFAQLIFKYNYPVERIDTEIYPPRREPKLPADIAVYDEKQASKVFIVVEVKAEAGKTEIETAQKEGLGNSTLLDAKYLFIVCDEEEQSFNVEGKPPLKELKNYRIPSIPIKYGKEVKYRYKKGDKEWDLKAISFKDLDYKFQSCHDAIWETGKKDPAQAFDEMSKLMFAKYFDELWNTKNNEYYTFQIGTHETEEVVAEKIHQLYKKAQKKEPIVFSEDIQTPSAVIFEVVRILENVSLKKTDLDAKGRAFEKFLGEIFRGKMGQYFTRREIVIFMANIVDPTVFDYILDPACGSGGFLLYSWQIVKEKLKLDYNGDNENISRLDWDFSHRHIYGIEKNDRIARIAMMDMVIHDDGHLNIENNDALEFYSKFDPKKEIIPGKYTCILTNPPFGSKEKRQTILNNYILGSKIKAKKSQRVEVLFIERCIDFLKENGNLAIVLPDPVLSNSTLKRIRNFILEKTKIIAVISLPQFAFRPVGSGMKTSLLFLKKKEDESDEDINYEVFLGGVERIGYDSTNRTDINDLPRMVLEYKKFISDAENYQNIEEIDFWTLKINLEKILKEGRFDAKYYNPLYDKIIDELSSSDYKLHCLGDLVIQPITSGATPKAKGDAYTTKDEGILFIRIVDIKDGDIILDDVLYIKPEIHNKMLKRTHLQPKDVLVSIAGTIGNTALVPEDLGEANINQAIALVRLKKSITSEKEEVEILPEYITLFLSTKYGNCQMNKISRPGAQANINTTELESILIPIPSFEIQQNLFKKFIGEKAEADKFKIKAKNVIQAARKKFESSLLA